MSLILPAGWMPTSAPGVDIALMPLTGPQQTSPTFTVHRWGDTPFGVLPEDPRQFSLPDVPGHGSLKVLEADNADRGFAVDGDRWVGEHWFGWRFLRLASTATGWPKAEIRWLMWPVDEPRVDMLHGDPHLDVTASCAVGDLPLLEVPFEAMASSLPADWTPARPAEDGRQHQEIQINVVPAEESEAGQPGGTDALSVDGSAEWSGMALFRVSARDLKDALDDQMAGMRALGRNSAVSLDILRRPEASSQLTIRDRRGSRVALTLYRSGGVVVAVVEGAAEHPDEVRVGMYPAARSAEVVMRAVGIGPCDARALMPDTVDLETMLGRAVDPTAELPVELGSDEQWRAVWTEPWALWSLATTMADPAKTDPTELMMLTMGRWGHQRLLRSSETGRVRLQPTQSSSLAVDLLRRLGGPRVTGA